MIARGVVWTSVLAAATAGCQAPSVTFRHALPADVPILGRAVVVEPFTAKDGPTDDFGRALAEKLVRQLNETAAFSAVLAGPSAAGADSARIGGTAQITVREHKGTRQVRRWDAEEQAFAAEDLPALSRSCDVAAVFLVAPAPPASEPVRIETAASYRSAEDPRARGPAGLLRGDDPRRIPPRSEIIDRLLDVCAARFVRVVRPRELVVTARLRAAPNADGRKGIEAAAAGDFAAAAGHFQAAVAARPKDAGLHFNLAVAREAAGDLQAALGQYQEALALRAGKDDEAQAGADRVESLLAKKRYEARVASTSAPAEAP